MDLENIITLLKNKYNMDVCDEDYDSYNQNWGCWMHNGNCIKITEQMIFGLLKPPILEANILDDLLSNILKDIDGIFLKK